MKIHPRQSRPRRPLIIISLLFCFAAIDAVAANDDLLDQCSRALSIPAFHSEKSARAHLNDAQVFLWNEAARQLLERAPVKASDSKQVETVRTNSLRALSETRQWMLDLRAADGRLPDFEKIVRSTLLAQPAIGRRFSGEEATIQEKLMLSDTASQVLRAILSNHQLPDSVRGLKLALDRKYREMNADAAGLLRAFAVRSESLARRPASVLEISLQPPREQSWSRRYEGQSLWVCNRSATGLKKVTLFVTAGREHSLNGEFHGQIIKRMYRAEFWPAGEWLMLPVRESREIAPQFMDDSTKRAEFDSVRDMRAVSIAAFDENGSASATCSREGFFSELKPISLPN